MAEVLLEKVTKRFPSGVYGCKDVTLTVRDGEFFVLLGPSGSGKTTLLRIIAGLEKPTEGRVYIDGVDVTDLPPRKRDVAMVFQTWALYPHMTVFDNIAFPLKIRGLDRAEIERKVKEVADLLGISDLLERYPRQLSGGQQQRVALARALVRNPKVWLMDEPLSNLDAILRVHMRVELKRLQRELKITTIYVTHDQAEAMSMADRIGVMSSGVMVQVGTPEEVYDNPANTFVASFIGNPPMNLVEADLDYESPRALLPSGYIQVPRDLHTLAAERGLKKVIVGFRPEDALVKPPGEEGIQGKVVVVENLGSDIIANIDVGNSIIKVRLARGIAARVKPGMEVKVWVDSPKVKLFNPSSGRRIEYEEG
ncbi:MAG: ABC transporter ATP-binding protein [Desulfurococcales archaeon]|nr:ABC transporter ATP-binding protein [Desulfurococcales archaeon]